MKVFVMLEFVKCGRCKKEIQRDKAEVCWYCLDWLCCDCWDMYGHCGHPEAEKANKLAREVLQPLVGIKIIHAAGEPVGLVQKCSRCGTILQDYTNVQGVGNWRPVWWDGNVFVDGRYSGATEEKANCKSIGDNNGTQNIRT